ncbi:hypothetical protein MMYC01_200784 [Madurella mycetomatis]|uniref:Uncharacterized protein n=1 Tax=Madurella mycetomatis TaxID=100816 RepID=A0A175WI65_9PEZI|nr:hypothetical protein MMYC01_200784 [Madurella mycetomatis]
MRHVSLYLLTAWSVIAVASASLDASFHGEFRMAMLAPRQATNLQAFTGALGGAGASAITNSGDPERPFEVDGDTFPDYETAAIRACDNQKNVCADLANNGTGSFSVGECDQQTGEFHDKWHMSCLGRVLKKAPGYRTVQEHRDIGSHQVFPRISAGKLGR